MRRHHLPLVVLLAACGRSRTEQSPAPPRALGPSLVLVTLDTTRVDRIGAYGYPGAHTPHIDALAVQGVRFAQAYTSVPLTTPSHATILTGLYPTRHGIHSNGDAILPDEIDTLAERLHARGWQTAASVAAFVTTRVWNLDQGFEAYYDEVQGSSEHPGNRWLERRPADKVVDDAVNWLSQLHDDRPFFLWVHLYDAHRPYEPPGEWAKKMPDRPYDAELAFMDEQLGRLEDEVASLHRPEGVGWIVVADHGEALSHEHGETDHGMFLFQPTVHVPFIVRPPEPLAEPRVVEETVGAVDVTPTALGMLGVSAPAGLDGRDLGPLLKGSTEERPPVYMEAMTVARRFGYHPEVGAVSDGLKLMDTPSPRLFDLVQDPEETRNLVDERPDDVKRLRAVIAAIQAEAVKDAGGVVAPELVEQLAALGYVAGARATTDSQVDAKDHLDTIREMETARVLARRPGKAAEAEQKYREVLAQNPGMAEARIGLARLLSSQQRFAEAEQVLRTALAADPTSTVIRVNLADALARQGRYDPALAMLDSVLKQVPGDRQTRAAELRILVQAGRIDEALSRARGWLQDDPTDHSVQAQAGLLLVARGEEKQGAALLRESLADDVPRPKVYEALAHVAAGEGDMDTALVLLRRELTRFPENADARWSLANALMDRQQWDEAAAEYHYLSDQKPDDVEARRAWAQAIFNTGDYDLAAQILAAALNQAPDDPKVLLLYANILGKQGDREQAQAVFEEAKRLAAAGRAARSEGLQGL